MRRSEKEKVEDMVCLLEQAHEEIAGAIDSRNIPDALNLLTDCQQGAISMGDLIEKAEGEDHEMIPILEKYCEEVYRVYESLVNKDEDSGLKTAQEISKRYEMLQNIFRRIKRGIHEIKIRREAVFLPYKASMWDSLESVWKAADGDPDCDAYVIPIPYYDKNPDGSFREEHYEGEQYPKYVPVTWYENYDFAKRKPDMIFIHNPYDEWNHVTSVHPFFYSKNLKQYTKQLVYIPYFVLPEIEPDNEEAVKGMEHFCTVPGVVYADKVVVQSEKMRQIYINVMTELMAAQGYTKEYWEKKILGLGSPKIDKLLSTKKKKLEIPGEWRKIIQKPDGSWKKVILYNTTVSALLRHEERMLKKIRNVLQTFYEYKDEIVMLWRPHPLMQATIESMRPQLWAGYQEIVEIYRKQAWGIYDDSADLDRALVISDAYYGDLGSLVELCKKTGMPIMIQNVEV